MFGLFKKKKSEKEEMEEKYAKLMKESFDLSKSNRMAADQKFSEAQDLLKEMEQKFG